MIVGSFLYLLGMAINWQSDGILINLRGPGETGYKIPHGGLFRYVTSPNYFGEMIEWLGFAIVSGSIAGFAFFFWTCANLIPRALNHHAWYQEQFDDYPKERHAVIPKLL